MTPLLHPRARIVDLLPGDEVLLGDMPYVVDRSRRGGMGFVLLLWKNHQKAPSRPSAHGIKLALKSVLPEAADEEAVRLFRRELTIWAAFRHANVVWLNEILDGGRD